MSNRTGLSLAVLMLSAAAQVFGSDTPPSILSGTWSGTAKASSFKESNSGAGGKDTSATPSRSSAAFTITFTQTGAALSLQTTIVSKDKSGATNTQSGTLAGVYGNGNFWATGVTSNANESHSIVLTGHVTSKTVKGIGIAFGASDETEVSYALKPIAAKQTMASSAAITSLCGGYATSRADTPFAVTGFATGKVYTISSAGKSAPIKDRVAGVVNDGTNTQTAVLTFSDSTGSETFTLTGPDFGKSFVVYGPDSTNTSQAVLSLHAPSTAAKGIGILYNNGALIEFKLGLKR